MSWLVLLALAQAPETSYTAKEAQALFTEANDAYYKQDYPAAEDKYRRLLKAGFGGPDVLFNLGTTQLAAGELGPAMVSLERAHRLSSDDDIEANLAVARQKQVDQVIGAAADAPFFQRLSEALDPQGLSIAFLSTWYAAFLLFALYRLSVGNRRVVLALAASVLFFVGLTLGAGVAVQAWVHRTVVEAIVTNDTAKVREFPGETAKVAFEVHAGLKVRVMEESSKYARIRLPNALEGWVEKEGLVEL